MLIRCNNKPSNVNAKIETCDDLKIMTFIVPHNKVKMCEAKVKFTWFLLLLSYMIYGVT